MRIMLLGLAVLLPASAHGQTKDRILVRDFLDTAAIIVKHGQDRGVIEAELAALTERTIICRVPVVVVDNGLYRSMRVMPNYRWLLGREAGKQRWVRLHLPKDVDSGNLTDDYAHGKRLFVIVAVSRVETTFTTSPVRKGLLVVDFEADEAVVLRVVD